MGQKKYKINKIIDEINYIDTECDINYADIDTITIIFNEKKIIWKH